MNLKMIILYILVPIIILPIIFGFLINIIYMGYISGKEKASDFIDWLE